MAAKKSSHLFIALIVDVCLVALFTVVGHYTHHHSLVVDELITAAWPFLAGLGIAWLLNAAWVAPLAPLRTGAGLWATTVLVGLIIRAITIPGPDGGISSIPGSFMIVAGSLNLVTLVGWRLIATAVAGRSAR